MCYIINAFTANKILLVASILEAVFQSLCNFKQEATRKIKQNWHTETESVIYFAENHLLKNFRRWPAEMRMTKEILMFLFWTLVANFQNFVIRKQPIIQVKLIIKNSKTKSSTCPVSKVSLSFSFYFMEKIRIFNFLSFFFSESEMGQRALQWSWAEHWWRTRRI